MEAETEVPTPALMAMLDELVSDRVASLCGLVLRRLQDVGVGDPENDQTAVTVQDLNKIFGEALEQFGGKHESTRGA
jgi:hypothetical protein